MGGAALSIVAVTVAILLNRYDPGLLSTTDVQTEIIAITIVDPAKAAFFVKGAKIGVYGSEPGPCTSGRFTPALGAIVTYSRVGRGPLEVKMVPSALKDRSGPDATLVGSFQADDNQPATELHGSTLIAEALECQPPSAQFISQRLPIWGVVEIGQEFRPEAATYDTEPAFLLQGKLDVAAHAIGSDALYQVTSVSLPPGSRLRTASGSSPSPTAPIIWWGAVSTAPDQSALRVVAATEAPRLSLYRPNRPNPDHIELSALTQITADPTIQKVTIVSGVLLFFVSKVIALLGLWQRHQEERSKSGAESGQ